MKHGRLSHVRLRLRRSGSCRWHAAERTSWTVGDSAESHPLNSLKINGPSKMVISWGFNGDLKDLMGFNGI